MKCGSALNPPVLNSGLLANATPSAGNQLVQCVMVSYLWNDGQAVKNPDKRSVKDMICQTSRSVTSGSGGKETLIDVGPPSQTGGVTLPSMTTCPAFRPPKAAASAEPANHASPFKG